MAKWLRWLPLLPAVVSLVDEVAKDLKDGALSPDELRAIGAKLVEIVASVLPPPRGR